MTITESIRWSYTRSLAFVSACPMLFLVPAAVEFAQHIAEQHLGMYRSHASFRASADSPLRMGLGHLKLAALLLSQLWVTRFIGFGNNAVQARRLSRATLLLVLPVLLWGILGLLIGLDGTHALEAVGISSQPAKIWVGVLSLSLSIVGAGLAPWIVASMLGDSRISFTRSLVLTRGNYLRALFFPMLVTLPIIALHYGLSYAALGRPPAAVWALLVLDSLAAALIGVVGAAGGVSVVLRITEAAHINLIDPAPVTAPA